MPKWRVIVIAVFMFVFGALILGRLFIVQVLNHDIYKAWARGQQGVFVANRGERGKIFFSSGQVVAANIKGKQILINPNEITNKEEAAKILGQTLNIGEDLILKKIESSIAKNEPEKMKEALTKEEEEKIIGLNIAGIKIAEEETVTRRYPFGEMASQLMGFMDKDGEGQYGVEGYYNDKLRGKDFVPDSGFGFGMFKKQGPTKGSDIYLTIDYNIQFKAEELLRQAQEDLKINSGQIIVADPLSGRILAMANIPGFNPNQYSEIEDYSIFINGATQKLFEPGSIFKPITMAGALDANKVTPQTKYVDEGVVKVGGSAVYNFDMRSYGERTMTEVLERSINTGAVFAQRQLGNDPFVKYIEKFGFFGPSSIDLQAEAYSENKELKKGYEINYCTAAFGQGIEVTPIQIIKAFSVIANGGKMVRPHVVDKIVSEDGKETKINPEVSAENVISSKAAAEVVEMMVSVIEKGFGKKAQIEGYKIAGKTGTAQVPYTSLGINKKGYSDNTWQSFVGFTPATNARFLALIKLDNPQARTAEYSAMPIFRELAKYIIDYLKIPPEADVEKETPKQTQEAVNN